MKTTILAALLLSFPLGAAAGASAALHPPRTVLVYDSGVVAAGAAIDSGVLPVDLAGMAVCSVYADNSAGAFQRLVTMPGYMADGTTAVTNGNAVGGGGNAPAATYGVFTVGIGAGTAGITNGAQYVLPPKMRFQMAAAGSSAGRLVVYCRG